ncbi:MAG: 7-cyano-7-deazaguanine synthase [Ignavibacteria bacterium]|nr:7-cyano-7-deazaguanine synthase [Ignavibacteria bacterium]
MQSNNINKIAIGIVGGGSNSMGYPDTNSKFLKSVDSLFSSTLDINVEGPIVSWTKKKVISFLNKNKFDFNLTFHVMFVQYILVINALRVLKETLH